MKSTRLFLGGVAVFLAGLLISFSCLAQVIAGNGDIQSQSRTTENFSKIDCSGAFHVVLSQGSETQIKVETDANLLPYIIADVSGSRLDLKTKRGVSLKPSKDITVYITLPDLEELNVSGLCKLQSQNTLQSDHLKLDISGTSEINLQLHTGTLNTKISGTSKMNLNGTATSSEYKISGSADILATNLTTENTIVSISGMGKLHVNAQKNLSVNISGMGKVWYKGNPSLRESVSGMGKVRQE